MKILRPWLCLNPEPPLRGCPWHRERGFGAETFSLLPQGSLPTLQKLPADEYAKVMITFTIAFLAVLFLKVKGSGMRLSRESPALIPKSALLGSPRVRWELCLSVVCPKIIQIPAFTLLCELRSKTPLKSPNYRCPSSPEG